MKGKNKEQFEEWYSKNVKFNLVYIGLIKFYNLPHEMQEGVIKAYYDSVGIPISTEYNDDVLFEEGHYFKVGVKSNYKDNCFDTGNEAIIEAFKEADRLINESLNK
jgi:hypothetical protein